MALDPEVERVLWWWLRSVPWMAGLSGMAPSGPPEWPLPGGMLHQPARLVAAVDILSDEWPHVLAGAVKRG